MKIRSKFVSNSSSASFIIDKSQISSEDLSRILNFIDTDQSAYDEEYKFHDKDYWEYNNKEGVVTGWTVMDNDVLSDWLEKNGLRDKVEIRADY